MDARLMAAPDLRRASLLLQKDVVVAASAATEEDHKYLLPVLSLYLRRPLPRPLAATRPVRLAGAPQSDTGPKRTKIVEAYTKRLKITSPVPRHAAAA